MSQNKFHGTEDEEHTLLYVDVLGFAALTKAYRTRVETHRDSGRGPVTSSITPIQSQIIGFHNAIDRCVYHETLSGQVAATLFSDSAFVDTGNTVSAALLAKDIMRECTKSRVPVRMGLGRGTFYPLNFSTESSGRVQISRSRFVGTTVVFAHAAEQAGGKGMRIFLHPSVIADLRAQTNGMKLLPLPKPFADATHELDYLYEPTAAGHGPSADEQDRELMKTVAGMKDSGAPLAVQRQYIETLKALNRMRQAHGRKRMSGGRRKA